MSSTGNSRSIDQQVSAFLADYDHPQRKPGFDKLADLAKKGCEDLLKSMGIKGVVQCRTKNYDSLKKKLKDMAQTRAFTDYVSQGNDIYKHDEMGDLAGVRIGLFFPGHVAMVAEELSKRYHIIHLFGTVTGGRKATQEDRKLEIQDHTKGPWRDDTGDHWEHYGYKSWQMVVQWKSPFPIALERINSLRVEIQIGTVVTQAWAEVQHNVIYKKPADILSTPSMKRMIDGINGLAITTEIMLNELARSLEQAEKEAEEARRKQFFGNGSEFLRWFESTYLIRMPPEESRRWKCRLDEAERLLLMCGAPFRKDSKDCTIVGPRPCPTDFKKFIGRKGLLEPKTKTVQELDISVLIRQAISDINNGRPLDDKSRAGPGDMLSGLEKLRIRQRKEIAKMDC
jgi:ppGpp synthetase/RelA/SpoT-type nucleotidyltranferase